MSPAWTGASGRALRVSLCSGLLVRHDAISNSLGLKLDLLRRLRREGQPVEVTAFVLGTDQPAPDVVTVGDVGDLARHPAFRLADVHVFEFGIHYDLFDAVFLLDPARVAAVYHNITPLELVTEPSARAAVERALVQKHNLVQAGTIICDSEFNRDDLVAFGIEPERLTVHHLPPAREALPRPPRPADAPVELLFVGRLVRQKGVLDLLEACEQLAGGPPARLTVVGSPTFADPVVLQAVQQAASGRADLHYAGELDDEAVARLASTTDVLVLPSYHEGYCVPVVEAYAAGCEVVAYDAGNLPNVVGGVGQLVRTGDVEGLAAAMRRAVHGAWTRRAGDTAVPVTGGELDVASWRAAVRHHLRGYDQETYEQSFLEVLGALAAGRAGEAA